MEILFQWLSTVEEFLWGFLGAPIILLAGLYLTVRSRFMQVRKFPRVIATFFHYLGAGEEREGVHPLKAFFACVGGCIGIGNIVSVCIAVQIGGPGALFWLWVTAGAGMMLKYGEVYLGIRYRQERPEGGYLGGPMYFLSAIFPSNAVPMTVAFLLCIYGVEVYQFRVVAESVAANFSWSEAAVAAVLLLLVFGAGLGGVARVGTISSVIIPVFVLLYLVMGLYVLFLHADRIPAVLYEVITSAFSGHAAVGGFAGSAVAATLTQGVRRGAYTGDVGVGYASVIHSETSVTVPQKQASLVIFDMFLDTFVVCTLSILLILVTGVWSEPLPASLLVQRALESVFPKMHLFMPFFIFLLGYSTINAYFVVGVNCSRYLSPGRGPALFYLYALLAFAFFTFAGTEQAISLMATVGALLLIVNAYGILRLSKEISYDV